MQWQKLRAQKFARLDVRFKRNFLTGHLFGDKVVKFGSLDSTAIFYRKMCARCRNEGGDIDFDLPKRKKKGRPVLVTAYIPTGEEERPVDNPVVPPTAPVDTSYTTKSVVTETERGVGGEEGGVMRASVGKASLPKRKRKARPIVISAYVPTEEEERLALEMDNQVELAAQSEALPNDSELTNGNEPVEAVTASTYAYVKTSVDVENPQLEPALDSNIAVVSPLGEACIENSALIEQPPGSVLLYWSLVVDRCKPYFVKLPMLRVSLKVQAA